MILTQGIMRQILFGHDPMPEAQAAGQALARAVGQLDPRLRYTRLVLNESLRLYLPTWVTARTSLAGEEIGGDHIPPPVHAPHKPLRAAALPGFLGGRRAVRPGPMDAGTSRRPSPLGVFSLRRWRMAMSSRVEIRRGAMPLTVLGDYLQGYPRPNG